jgi:hypothetical protein
MLLGSARKRGIGRKKLLQFVAVSMLWLDWPAQGKNACMSQMLLVILQPHEGSNREMKSWL